MSQKKLILLNTGIAILILGIWYVASNWSSWDIGYKFVATFFCAVVFGVLFVVFMLPRLAEAIGAYFYSAPEQIKPDEYTRAAAKVSQGDYEGAIVAYRKIAADEPDNRFPIIEIAKIQRENLEDSDAAIQTLETAIEEKSWEVNDAAAMVFRLEDIYLTDKENPERAKELLQMIVDEFPETRHAANAHHKLNEMSAAG